MTFIWIILALLAIFVYPIFALSVLCCIFTFCILIMFIAGIGILNCLIIFAFLAYFAGITKCVMSAKFNFLQLAHKLLLIASMPCSFIVFCVVFTGGFNLLCFVITVPIVIFSSVLCAYVINKDKDENNH